MSKHRLTLWVGLLCIGIGTAQAGQLTGKITWTDPAPTPPLQVTLLRLDSALPLWQAKFRGHRSHRFRVPDLSEGLYLLLIESSAAPQPLVRWFRVTRNAARVHLDLRLSRRVFRELQQSYELFRLFMRSTQRTPLHQEGGVPAALEAYRPPRMSHRDALFTLSYWTTAVPQRDGPGMWVQAAGWQWHLRRRATFEMSLLGRYVRGAYERWTARSDMRWQMLQTHEIRLQFQYDRLTTLAMDTSGFHSGSVGLHDSWRVHRNWSITVNALGRIWLDDAAHPYPAYRLSGELQYQPNRNHGLFVDFGLGRISWLDTVPAHPYRQTYWFEQWVRNSPRWSEWFTENQWVGSGYRGRLDPGEVRLRVRLQRYRGAWTWPGAIRTGAAEIEYRLNLPRGQVGVQYALERVWRDASGLARVSRAAWIRFLRTFIDVRLPRAGELSLQYAIAQGSRFLPERDLPAVRTLDVEWRYRWVLDFLAHARVETRFAVLNLLNQAPGMITAGALPNPYFWLQVPRAWVWSVTTLW